MGTDKFYCANIESLLEWILFDLEQGEALGIAKELFFTPREDDPFRMVRYGKLLETPLGVAAGPHTQLAQNIIAAWLTGARYIELKTIQVLDELEVTKPCIDMTDEGYNCEWSQELKLDRSFNEYLNAHILLYVLKDRLGRQGEEAGWIFNMSAGYNLEGIMTPSVQRFFDRMENCPEELAAKIERLVRIYPRIKKLKIPSRISDNLTVSTMHGCPPDEVEKIGRYFIEARGYHTTIKLNPTLLGPERLRGILNDMLGFETVVPDEAFGHDLKYNQGEAIIRNLTKAAQKKRRRIRRQADQHPGNHQYPPEPAQERRHGLHVRARPASHQHQPRRQIAERVWRSSGHLLFRRGGHLEHRPHPGLRPQAGDGVLRPAQAGGLRASFPIHRNRARGVRKTGRYQPGRSGQGHGKGYRTGQGAHRQPAGPMHRQCLPPAVTTRRNFRSRTSRPTASYPGSTAPARPA